MAKEKTDKKTEPASDLIALTKNGKTIHAHETQVALWISQGWEKAE